jgi:16S rRNA (uracil1498-N3)-methyltransferase
MSVQALPWYYANPLPTEQQQVLLQGEEWHHAAHVLRMHENDHLVLFDGKGKCIEGRLSRVSRSEGEIEFLRDLTDDFKADQGVRINIAFAPTKNIDRTEFAVEKIVELGVHGIFFLECQNSERTVLRIDRMEKIVIAAAKQSRKLFLPQLHEMIKPAALVQQFRTNQPGVTILCMHLDEESQPLSRNYQGQQDVLVLIGPEGDFSKKEIEDMKSLEGRMTSLGPHRLRVETAAITACANITLLHSLNKTI